MNGLELIALTPVLILVLGGTALLMAGAWYRQPDPLLAGGISVALAAGLSALLLTPPVQEIAGLFSSTPYARFFTLFWSLSAALMLMISVRYVKERSLPAGEYVSLVLFAAAGMALLSSATSLIGIFLGLEAFTLAFYILIACNRHCDLSAEAGLKYLVMGAVATGFMAFGIALIYACSGSFHLPEALQGLATAGALRPWGLLGWGMLLVAIGFKISLVPFHLWTPDVYQGAPTPVVSLLATGSKGAVAAALIGLFASGPSGWTDMTSLLWLLSALTMLVGALCALPQTNIKRLLAYSSVVHMGTLLIGLLCQTSDGLAASVFYVTVYCIASLGSFAIITSMADGTSEPTDLEQWRGLGYRHPVRCGVLTVLLLSLAGMPPTAGFMAKFAIFHAAIQADFIGLALVGILASLISFAFYLKVIMVMFMTDETAPACHPGTTLEHSVLAICTGAVLLFGLFPGLLFDLIGSILP
jgi:NADH-quinone oxidoreductase subunit N